MLVNYKLKNFKLQYLFNPIHHYKAENLKFSKMHKKNLSRLQKRPQLPVGLILEFSCKVMKLCSVKKGINLFLYMNKTEKKIFLSAFLWV